MVSTIAIPTASVSDAMAAYTIGFAKLEVHRVEDAIGAGSGSRWAWASRRKSQWALSASVSVRYDARQERRGRWASSNDRLAFLAARAVAAPRRQRERRCNS